MCNNCQSKVIPVSVLQKLPLGKPLGIEVVENMDREMVAAVKWMWYELTGWRVAFFALKDGAYIGEAGGF